MKNISIALACMCLFFGCAKDEQPEPVMTKEIPDGMQAVQTKSGYAYCWPTGAEIDQGYTYHSNNGRARLVFEYNGNLVLYSDYTWVGHSNTHRRPNPPNKCYFQEDGNLVLYRGGQPIWHSCTVNPFVEWLMLHHTGASDGYEFYIKTWGDEIVWAYMGDKFQEVFPGYQFPWWP